MSMLLVLLLFVAISVVVAVRANVRFRAVDRLPMQWSLTGEVNWFAPRRIALGIMPGLTFALLGVQVGLSLFVPPRAGQEHLVLPVLILTGVALLGGQQLHLWLAARTIGHRE